MFKWAIINLVTIQQRQWRNNVVTLQHSRSNWQRGINDFIPQSPCKNADKVKEVMQKCKNIMCISSSLHGGSTKFTGKSLSFHNKNLPTHQLVSAMGSLNHGLVAIVAYRIRNLKLFVWRYCWYDGQMKGGEGGGCGVLINISQCGMWVRNSGRTVFDYRH